MQKVEMDLREEVMCDYLVTTKQKKVWACLLDMLAVVDDICKRHGIKYYAVCGTLLGAVRHGGFIPWDDDLDIGMMRQDYNRFLEIAQRELKGKYFLQTTLTDVRYYKEHARIRNSETTGICEHYERHGCNNGIYLDILPLERYSYSLLGKMHCALMRAIGRVLTLKVHYRTLPQEVIRFHHHVIYFFSLFVHVKSLHRFREWLETRNAKRKTEYVSLGDVYYANETVEKLVFPVKAFEPVAYLPFEHTQIPAPSDYAACLTIEFGDYMQFPPVEKRGKHHGIVFDPDTPYAEYIQKHYGTNNE